MTERAAAGRYKSSANGGGGPHSADLSFAIASCYRSAYIQTCEQNWTTTMRTVVVLSTAVVRLTRLATHSLPARAAAGRQKASASVVSHPHSADLLLATAAGYWYLYSQPCVQK